MGKRNSLASVATLLIGSVAQPHGGPWQAARGGFSHDVTIQIEVPPDAPPKGLSQQDVIWWIAALLRIGHFPYLSVPILSDRSLADAAANNTEPTITPFETQHRIFSAGEADVKIDGSINWIASVWREGAQALLSNGKFNSAIRAFDACTISGRTSSSMLALWGGLEQLFSTSPNELRYRVSCNVAAYLEPYGPSRLELQKKILRLYGERSKAAHTANETELEPLVESYVVMRNALMKMIQDQHVPTSADFDELLFSGAAKIQSGFPKSARTP